MRTQQVPTATDVYVPPLNDGLFASCEQAADTEMWSIFEADYAYRDPQDDRELVLWCVIAEAL